MAPEVSTPFARYPHSLSRHGPESQSAFQIQFAQDQDASTLEVNQPPFSKWWFLLEGEKTPTKTMVIPKPTD